MEGSCSTGQRPQWAVVPVEEEEEEEEVFCQVEVLYKTSFSKSINLLDFDPNQGQVSNRYESI
jgi:hypothetical protein